MRREETKKLIEAIACFVKEHSGYLTKTKLVKLLYLIDIEYFKSHKTTFTEFDWIFYEYGPWTKEFEELYAELTTDGTLDVSSGQQAEFISTSCEARLENILPGIADKSAAERVIRRWMDEKLEELLNFVYFHTPPMRDVERYARLDFSNVLEMIPNYSLSKGDQQRAKQIKRTLEERRAARQPVVKMALRYKPPEYDDAYIEAIDKLNEDFDY